MVNMGTPACDRQLECFNTESLTSRVQLVAAHQTERLTADNKIIRFPRDVGTEGRRTIRATTTCKVLKLPRPRPAQLNDRSDRLALGIVTIVLAFTIAAIGAAGALDMRHTQDCFPASACKHAPFKPFDGYYGELG